MLALVPPAAGGLPVAEDNHGAAAPPATTDAPAVPAADLGTDHADSPPDPQPDLDPEPEPDPEQVRRGLLHNLLRTGHPILCALQEVGTDGLTREQLERIEVFQRAAPAVLDRALELLRSQDLIACDGDGTWRLAP